MALMGSNNIKKRSLADLADIVLRGCSASESVGGELPEEAWFHFEKLYRQPESHSIEPNAESEQEGNLRANQLRVTLAPRYFVQLSLFDSSEHKFLTFDFYLTADPGTPPALNHDAGVLPTETQLSDRSLIRLPYRDQQGAKRRYVYLYLIDYALHTSYRKLVRGDELVSRGWVFQEQMLSRKLVYYTNAGIILECWTGNPQNTLGDKWTKSGVEDDDSGAIFTWTRRSQEDADQESKSLISVLLKGKFDLVQRSFDIWYKHVEEYSVKELTYWGDHLPALSGIWTRDVYFGLLWTQQEDPKAICQKALPPPPEEEPPSPLPPPPPKKIERVEGIPSWSWASLPAEVLWGYLYPHRKKLVPSCMVMEVVQTSEGQETIDKWELPIPGKKDKKSKSASQPATPLTLRPRLQSYPSSP
ncbi:hypothetical protein G7Y89_g12511 [Cudoniella acicularis]|uniref:Uncharacterized protein n=1 Tax=Cudoniella acicularis TaxID=354080 RepID=A0A8H4R8Z5_9HELO|nr:hypothetical protein G7Y89_g12511 [Cudoniella acicularis]